MRYLQSCCYSPAAACRGGLPVLDPMVLDPAAVMLDPAMAMMAAPQIFVPGGPAA